MDEDWIDIRNESLSAAINPLGAELSSLEDADGGQLLTDGDPAWWTGRAPLLFPIIGELAGGEYRLDGKTYALPRHGFARRQPFKLLEREVSRVALRLSDNEATRAAYPFAFTLDVAFTLEGTTLLIDVRATNDGNADMPASFGFHPGFRWPLPYGAPRETHAVVFAQEEPEPLARLANNLIAADPRPSPLQGRRLSLRDDLFADDALIWENVRSDHVIYGAEGSPSLRIGWKNTPNLGIWTKPGAPFVCIEPWAGIADTVGFSGEIWDKPGIVRIPPGESQSWAMEVTLRPG
ncbi:MAG: aldose 1-epimerase family protein [Sphingobium sp.]|nr:aldose 1-epimerase family protein [Sphingobium sp.]